LGIFLGGSGIGLVKSINPSERAKIGFNLIFLSNA
jgi:hypothetical protein